MKDRAIFLFIVITLTACTPTPAQKPTAYVDLSNLAPLPVLQQQEGIPLRVAIAAVISPKGTADSYSMLLDYLSENTGRSVELVQRRTYMEVNDLIERGEVDMAFVCTSAYIVGRKDFGMELLVAPQVKGESVYYSYLIVPADSLANDIADLKDKVFAFTDPISMTGRSYPTYLVQQLDSTPETFFKRTFFTYSHDEAIYAVANKLADGASVDSLVYDFSLERNPSLAQKIRIIHKSPAFGIPPVVVNPNIRPQVKEQLQHILLNMQYDPEGLTALHSIGIDKFVTITDSAYESVRTLVEEVSLVETP